MKLGDGKERQDRLTNFVAIFENSSLDFSKNRAEGDDILEDAYEYLMRHFATERGKSKGQFYTPARGRSPARTLLNSCRSLYGECMARLISTTIRLDEEDVRALKRARAAGHSTSDLVRKGLRVVASRYYSGRRPPSTLLFESTDTKLGDESELFRDLDD